jgi:hypothetical protein
MSESRLAIPLDLLAAYSRAEITRRELAERIGEPVGFGRLPSALHHAGLPVPRIPSIPDAPGVRIVHDLTRQAMARHEYP